MSREVLAATGPGFVDGTYRSGEVRRPLLARVFPSLWFYEHFFWIVWRAAGQARRGDYDYPVWSSSSLEVLRALEAVGMRFEVTGVEHLERLGGPCVFIGNHMSSLETFVLPTIIVGSGVRMTFVVKRSLTEYPLFGHVMRSRDPIVVGRSNPRDDLRAVLEGGEQRLRSGIAITVFPQTTRTPTFDPASFNTIGVKLAKRAKVPVVPIALKTDAWPNGRLVKDFGRLDTAKLVRIAFGEPLQVAGNGAAEHHQVIDFVRERLLAWGGKVAPAADAAR